MEQKALIQISKTAATLKASYCTKSCASPFTCTAQYINLKKTGLVFVLDENYSCASPFTCNVQYINLKKTQFKNSKLEFTFQICTL